MSDEFLSLERQADEMERQADALEAIATELRYQNAVLCETVAALDDLSTRVDERPAESEPRDRSDRAMQTDIADRLFDRDEADDAGYGHGRAENWRGDR
ncbi:hypothetical protein [Natronoglomus mannanivorans]|uniref:Uncharacterized protein n=1 Tax=Natronoglomus mannanivorans TaxID=2979990 RepID=A0AAP2Z3R2_9EURY|nr:hypothetical protein [Halobacteria archaeon AArc-xg1-1]